MQLGRAKWMKMKCVRPEEQATVNGMYSWEVGANKEPNGWVQSPDWRFLTVQNGNNGSNDNK